MRLIDRFYAARDRLLSDPKFQRWAASFFFTRGIARRRANALFDLTAGFVYAQILSACVRLSLLENLRDGPLAARVLAPKLSLDEKATTTLLKAAASLGLISTRGLDDAGGLRYGLGMDGAALLGNPGALAMIAHHDQLYADLSDSVALLQGRDDNALHSFWPYAGGGGAEGNSAPYTQLMSESQPLVTQDILDAYDFAKHHHLADCGGGDGTFLAAVLSHVPKLRGTLVDLPAVAEIARKRFVEAKLFERANICGGDLWRDPLPPDADAMSLVRVLHDHNDDRVATLLHRIFESLPPGGTLIIAEPMVAGSDTHRMGHAYFGFYLLAMGSGRARTIEEYRHMLHAAGFHTVDHVKTRRPLLCSVITARR